MERILTLKDGLELFMGDQYALSLQNILGSLESEQKSSDCSANEIVTVAEIQYRKANEKSS